MIQHQRRAVVGIVITVTAITMGACGARVTPRPETRPAPSVTITAVTPQPFRQECAVSPDTIERRAAAGRPIPGCRTTRPHSFGDERRTPSR